jgi:DNA-binding CsgD family transcriptional regulator
MSEWQQSPSAIVGRQEHDDAVSLSRRQVECLYWAQEGKSSKDIGVILGISSKMVDKHMFRACRKLGVRMRIQAVVRAGRQGLIKDPVAAGPSRDG